MQRTTTRQFRFVPIDSATADALRTSGGIGYVADSKPGYPCRQCLTDAEIGDELILVAHDPFTHDSPYRGTSPIFLHAQPCELDPRGTLVPDQLTIRQLSVRAFDGRAMMIEAAVIDGRELERTIERFFEDENTDRIHVHNASRGCWAVTVVRA
jgi:hypothetical protein